MPSLVETYKKYHSQLKKLDTVYKKLKAKEHPISTFLEHEQNLYNKLNDLKLQSVPISEKLEKAKEKKNDLEGKLSKLDPKSQEAQDISLEIQEVNRKITQQQQKVEENKRQIIDAENKISWRAENGKFSTQRIKEMGVSQSDFNAYMDTLKEALKIREKLTTLQGQIKTLLTRSISSEVDNPASITPKSLEKAAELAKQEEVKKKQALNWSKEHISPIIHKITDVGNTLVDSFQCDLATAHDKTSEDHLHYLGKSDYKRGFESGKYHLNDLETLVSTKQKKQEHFRSLLPDYVTNEIPTDHTIKGVRAYGIGKSNTEERVINIKNFLEKPFSDNQVKDIAKLKDLFAKAGITLKDDALNRIYNSASREQQEKLGVEEDFRTKIR